MLLASGWTSYSPQFTLRGQFPGVPWYPHPNRLPHRHLFWHLRLSGGHHGQLLPRFHRPLFPALEQRQQGRWGGGKWLMRVSYKPLHERSGLYPIEGLIKHESRKRSVVGRWADWVKATAKPRKVLACPINQWIIVAMFCIDWMKYCLSYCLLDKGKLYNRNDAIF